MIRSPFTLSLPTLALSLALVGAGRSPAQAVRGEHDPGAKLEQLAAENAVLKRELRAIKEIVDGVVAREPQSGAGLKVGVVDVGVLLAKHPQRAAFEAELDGERESAKATLARKKQELDTLQQQGEETTQAAAKFKALQERYQSNFAKSEDAITLTLLADVEGAIQTFAEREGYDLILKVDRGAEKDEELESRLYRAQVASVVGGVFAIAGAPAAIGPWVTGWLYDVTGGYAGAFAGAAALNVLALVLTIVLAMVTRRAGAAP